LVQDRYVVLIIVLGEGRDGGKQSIAQRTSYLGPVLEPEATEHTLDLLGNLAADHHRALIVTNLGYFTAIGFDSAETAVQLDRDRVLVRAVRERS
jgi:hypothetical protein